MFKVIYLVMITLVLAACGGGSSGGGNQESSIEDEVNTPSEGTGGEVVIDTSQADGIITAYFVLVHQTQLDSLAAANHLSARNAAATGSGGGNLLRAYRDNLIDHLASFTAAVEDNIREVAVVHATSSVVISELIATYQESWVEQIGETFSGYPQTIQEITDGIEANFSKLTLDLMAVAIIN